MLAVRAVDRKGKEGVEVDREERAEGRVEEDGGGGGKEDDGDLDEARLDFYAQTTSVDPQVEEGELFTHDRIG